MAGFEGREMTNNEIMFAGNWFQKAWDKKDIFIKRRDAEVLRRLAARVRALSERPVEAEKRRLWTLHNDLGTRQPLVFMDAENGWNEIITDADLQCEETMARSWEFWLRKELFWGEELRDDKVIDAVFYLPYVATDTGWGIQPKFVRSEGVVDGAYRWEQSITDAMMEDPSLAMSSLIHTPEIEVDREASDLLMETARSVFGGILETRFRHWWWWGMELTHPYADLRTLESMLYDFYDYPERVHEIMRLFTDGYMAKLDYLERNRLLPNNVGNSYCGSGGFGFTSQLQNGEDFDPDWIRAKDIWGFMESQETSSVSPEMFAEFVLPYQMEMARRFGLVYYGCCESLDLKWKYIRQIPNLRRVSVSNWATPEVMAENLGDKYVYCCKPSPSDLAVPEIAADAARARIRRVLRAAKEHGNIVELIMKDTHTLGGNRRNAIRWVEIAREEIDNVFG